MTTAIKGLWLLAVVVFVTACAVPTVVKDVEIEDNYEKYGATKAYGKKIASYELGGAIESANELKMRLINGITHQTSLDSCKQLQGAFLASVRDVIQRADEFNTRYDERVAGEALYELDKAVELIVKPQYCEGRIAEAIERAEREAESRRIQAEREAEAERKRHIARIKATCPQLEEIFRMYTNATKTRIYGVEWHKKAEEAHKKARELGYAVAYDERIQSDIDRYCN